MSFELKKFLSLVLFFLFFCTYAIASIYSTENFKIYYNGIEKNYIKRFSEILERDVDEFQRKIGKYPEYSINIFVADNEKDYLKRIKSKKRIIEFSDAVYIPNKNLIVIKNPQFVINYNLIHRIVLHEYIHSFVHYYFYNPPLWFNEGMAVYFSNDFGLDREMRFVISYLLQNPLRLTQMTKNYPKSKAEWEFFYAKSALAVKYLYTSDKNKFIRFWDLSKKNSDFYKIFRLTYRQSVIQFSKKFELYCKNHFKVMIITASSSLLWGFLPFLMIIVFIRKKLKYKKLYERGEDFEEI